MNKTMLSLAAAALLAGCYHVAPRKEAAASTQVDQAAESIEAYAFAPYRALMAEDGEAAKPAMEEVKKEMAKPAKKAEIKPMKKEEAKPAAKKAKPAAKK